MIWVGIASAIVTLAVVGWMACAFHAAHKEAAELSRKSEERHRAYEAVIEHIRRI